MASSLFPQLGGSSIMNAINALKMAANGDVHAACRILDNDGVVRTLPNGRQVNASQFMQMMQGRTPEQAFHDNGMDFNQFRNLM